MDPQTSEKTPPQASPSDSGDPSVPETSPEDRPSFSDNFPASRLAVFVGIVVLGLAADLVTKERAFSALGMPGGEVHWFVNGVLGVQTTLNEGGLFGMGQGYAHLLSAVSIAALLGIFVWCRFGALRDRVLTLVLGMVSAGILGNLYDRLGLHGLRWAERDLGNGFVLESEPVYAVRDWILVMLGRFHWPNFNIADVLLVCGAILLGLYAFLMPENGDQDKTA